MALWAATPDTLAQACHRAAACGLVLARRHRRRGQIPLTTRFGIGVGSLCGAELGGLAGRRHCMLSGAAIEGATRSSRQALAGHVVLDAGAWRLVVDQATGQPCPLGGLRITSLTPAPPAPPPGSPPLKADQLRTYLPPAVLARAASGQGAWLAELRTVTAIFAHVPDLDAGRDLHRAQDLVLAIQTALARHETDLLTISVDDHGTCLVAAAGLPPFAHGDDPVRAIDAALALAEALGDAGVGGAVGVGTGRAFCGPVGNAARREYTVIGDVVNTAARLMQNATAGGTGTAAVLVLCDSPTERATRHRFRFGDVRQVQAKGKREPLLAYEPDRRTPATTPTLATRPVILGRQAERRHLGASIDRVLESGPRVVLIEGEAGIGKSRLMAELPQLAATRGVRLLTGAADYLERSVPYRAWRTVFSVLLGLDASPTSEPPLPPEHGPLAPLLNGLLGLHLAETAETTALRGEQRVKALRQLLVKIVAAATTRRPLVVALEDVHWLDSASWALILTLSRQPLPLLLVLASRPLESQPQAPEALQLRAEPATDVVTLGPLPPDRLPAFLRSRLGVERVPSALTSYVAERSGGNPLFAEELLYTLRDAGILRIETSGATLTEHRALERLSIPNTIEGVIGSRIDGLGAEAELALKVASALGQTFAKELLADVHPVTSDRRELDTALTILVTRRLIVPKQPADSKQLGDCEQFAFHHALIREVAYHRMLARQRRQLHRRIAHRLEAHPPDSGAATYALLGHHWSRAGVRDKACDYLRHASIQAVNDGMGIEAVNLGLHAAELLGVAVPRDPDGMASGIREALESIREQTGPSLVDRLQALPAAVDRRAVAAIGILVHTVPAAFMTQQAELFTLIGLRNMLLTLQYGTNPYTPGVIAIYGMVARALSEDPGEAFALTSLAKQLAESDSPALISYTGMVHSWFVHHWLRPISEDLPVMPRQAHLGFEHGDVMFGCFNLASYVVLLARSGAPVPAVIAAARRNAGLIGGRVAASMFHCRLELQVARALAGKTIDPCSLTDPPGVDNLNEDDDVAVIADTDLYNQIAYYWSAKARLHTYYRQYEQAVDCALRTELLLPSFAGQIEEAEFTLFYALSLLGLAGEHPHSQVVTHARELLARIQTWERYAPDNFRHKSLLIEGQLAGVTGQAQRACELLDEAAAAALRIGCRQHAAFASELAGDHLVTIGRDVDALARLRRAGDCYRRWGALAKVADIRWRIAELTRRRGASGYSAPAKQQRAGVELHS
ncbi:MAG: ATP-binding protein [Pseudonocardiaceae bacterium]